MHSRIQEAYPQYIETMITSRGFAAAMDFVEMVRTDPETRALHDELLLWLIDGDGASASTALALMHDLLMGATDQAGFAPVAAFWAGVTDPERRFDVATTGDLPFLTHVAWALDRTLEIDPDDVGIDLLRRGILSEGGETAPLDVLGAVIRRIHRAETGSEAPMAADDMSHLYGTLVDYIRDDFRGLERCFELIQDRYGAQD
jgi:hypothetical protein